MGTTKNNKELKKNNIVSYKEEKQEVVEPVVEEKEIIDKPIIGIVSKCDKLNVRAKASYESEILEVLNIGESVEVDFSKNPVIVKGFYRVITSNGTKGYCDKNFIAVER